MSGRVRTQTKTKLKPLPKTELRADNAAGAVYNMTGDAELTRTTRDGFRKNYWAEVDIYGLDRNGNAREKLTYGVDQHATNADEMVSIEDDDSKSTITRTCTGLAKAIERTKDRYDRKGLRPDVRWRFRTEIERDPARRAAAQAELGTVTSDPPQWAAGYSDDPLFTLRPGKDKNQYITSSPGRRNKRA